MRSSRNVNLAAALLLFAPLAARAQAVNLLNRVRGAPTGIAVPGVSIAGAEEPTAVQLNPAGTGFVDAFTLQYFHQGRSGTGLGEDGFWLTAPLGGLVPTLAMEWIRPQDGGGARFRKTTFGLAVPYLQTFSVGIGANFYASPDKPLEDLWSLDAGATWRPTRYLSLGAAVRGMNAELAGRRLPIQYDLGLATRLWRDRLTFTGDLLSDDQARGDLRAQAVQLGGAVQVGLGFSLSLQWLVPLRSENGSYSSYPLFALTFDGAHGGFTSAGGAGRGSEDTWLVGARLSSQRYRDGGLVPRPTPLVDVARALARSRSLVFAGPRDPWGTLLRRLREARDDPRVPALALRIDDLPVGQARIEELRRLVLSIKAKKPVIAYLVGGGMKEYYLASAASTVLAPPSAELFPSGLSSTTPFLGEGLSRLGVAFDVVAIGRYKNAPDPLTRRDMSDAQREVTDRILDDVFARQVRAIASARGLDETRVRELIDVGIFNAEQALAAKLIDAMAWPDELDALASLRTGRRVGTSNAWDDAAPRAAQRWGPRPVVAVVRIEGTIASGKSRDEPLGGGIAGAETVAQLVKRAASDHRVRAIVLRVDSPGG
ncbi:MAG TPA: S49 family peptidase, partial [Anaeromyxobacteraceae bacterium]